MFNDIPRYLWVDLEMSGLDVIKNRILEFACILTDRKLKIVEKGPHLVIKCDEAHLKTMDEWNTNHHRKSGLCDQCLKSNITIEDADNIMVEFLTKNKCTPKEIVIAGNSVHVDKQFLAKYMPKLNNLLHYRILDVTSVKMAIEIKNTNCFFKKNNSHRALEDIEESIRELQFYLKTCFK